MSEKRFGWDCPYKDNRDFCTALLKPRICCPSICLFGLSDKIDEQQSIIHRDEISIKTMMSNIEKLEKENEKLSKQLEDCKDYNSILYKNCLQKDRRWLKRIKRVEDELEEYVKENARLREMYIND